MKAFVHTIRFRLTVWYASLLTGVLVCLAVLLYLVLRHQLVGHHDAALREAAAAAIRVVSGADATPLTATQRTQLDQIGRLVLFQEIDGRLQAVHSTPDAQAAMALVRRPHRPLPSAPVFETVTGPARLQRVYREPYRTASGRRGLIQTAHSLGDVSHALEGLALAFLLLAPVAVLLSGAGGYWLAGRALAPVGEVTRLAREIEATSLSRRLPASRAADEIGLLVATLNQMIARLEASFDAMKRFTADASHELRGPLATMRSAIDVALARPRSAEDYRKALASVGQDVDRLRSLTEDLLMLARADAGHLRLEREPVRLDVVAREVCDTFQAATETASVGVVVECDAPVVVLGDERWLRQLVFSLVDNAIKFSAGTRTSRPGSVRVRVHGATEHTANLEVADCGPGVPPGELERIFERFHRVDRARTPGASAGSGLGLAIAVWIAQAHSGTIAAANRPEGGSLFRVTLPRSPG